MRLSALFVLLASAAGSVMAHMEMIDPFPILSPANPAVSWEVKNYNMMAPLTWSGDDLPYPCKGYLMTAPAKERISQKTWPAGSSQSVTLGPNGATHRGGSCQLSLSYDYGRTWQVILSIMGGCPTDTHRMDFVLPSEAPSGEAVFSWSWFNHQGNREMYQNCAIITVTGGGDGLSPADYPPPFVANAGVNKCSTVEGVDPVFPNPGKNVRFGGDYKGQVISQPRGITGENCVDQYAGETPAGSEGRREAGVESAPASSSSTAARSSTSSVTTAQSTAASSTSTAVKEATSVVGNQHIVTPPAPRPSTTTSSSTAPTTSSTPSPASSSTAEASSSASSSAVPFSETSSATAPTITAAQTTTLSPERPASSSSSSSSSSSVTDTSTTPIPAPTAISTTELPTPSPSSSSSSSTSTPSPGVGSSTCKRKTRRSEDGLVVQGGQFRLVRRVVKQGEGGRRLHWDRSSSLALDGRGA